MMLRVVLRVRRMTIGVRRSDLGRERLALTLRELRTPFETWPVRIGRSAALRGRGDGIMT